MQSQGRFSFFPLDEKIIDVLIVMTIYRLPNNGAWRAGDNCKSKVLKYTIENELQRLNGWADARWEKGDSITCNGNKREQGLKKQIGWCMCIVPVVLSQ